jgi:hypothetical protein
MLVSSGLEFLEAILSFPMTTVGRLPQIHWLEQNPQVERKL